MINRLAPLALLLLPAAVAAQRADTTRADTTRAQPLPLVRVEITGEAGRLGRVPWAVGVADRRELQRGQPTVGLDEALSGIPGVLVANRYNFALDQRLVVRGFGTRANFGVRGVKILLDGIPQTFPDGQSQLTNVELGAISRVEVLRGSASSLYGNGAGGVIAFTSDLAAPEGVGGSVRAETGAFGLGKVQARIAGRSDRAVGALSLSRLTWTGFRDGYGAAELQQLNGAADWSLSPATTLSVRAHAASTPEAENPGALTAAEFDANPDSAAVNNVRRGADKVVSQQQLSLRLRRELDAGLSFDASVHGIRRDLQNAIAAAPPGGGGPANGVFITLDREAGGARAAATWRVANPRAPSLTAGAEWQRMRDRRENRRATAGRPTTADDTLLLSQIETVESIGPFAQLAWAPTARLYASAGARYDRVRFAIDDRFASDGIDDGKRTLPAWSGHLGASYQLRAAFAPYVNVSTSFETPTTTELQDRPDDLGGFNSLLGPQRSVSTEVGARGALADGRVSYSASLFRVQVMDAIVQYLETGGRAYFRNAGETRNDGAEVGLGVALTPRVGLDVAYTYSDYRFVDYRIVEGEDVTVLDGRRVPGVPEHFLRVGVRTRPLASLTLDVDHTVSSAVFADDANDVRVEGWGPGITDARLAWDATVGGVRVQPFGGVRNLFGRRCVSSVVVNGFGGRVREPGPGANWYVGAEVGVR